MKLVSKRDRSHPRPLPAIKAPEGVMTFQMEITA